VLIPAPAELRQQTLDRIQLPVVTTDGEVTADPAGRDRRRKSLFVAALLFTVLGAAGGLAYIGLHEQSVEINPADVTGTLTTPSPTPSAPEPPSAQPGPGNSPATTPPSVLAPSTTTEVPTPASAPPVDSRPPQVSDPVPEGDPIDPPAGDPVVPESGSDPTRNGDGSDPVTDPTTERQIPNGIAGIPQNPGPTPPRRATNNSSLPGDNNSNDNGSDGRRSSSPRRGTPRP
jgi:hypothetical protein